MDSVYIQNNATYGIQLECTASFNNTPAPFNSLSADAGPSVHGYLDATGVNECLAESYSQLSTGSAGSSVALDQLGGNWSQDDMGTFSMQGLELDPLPSLFSFSPGNFKSECNNVANYPSFIAHNEKKQPHDVADVLLSLKHAVVHPGEAPPLSPSPYHHSQATQQTSSGAPHFNIHSIHSSHQMLLSPTGYTNNYYDPPALASPPIVNGSTNYQSSAGGPSLFPSMSVNVQMNMTMHGYPNPYPEISCSQVQWNQQPQPAMFHQSPNGILSPSYPNGATYSFTADFRAPVGDIRSEPLISASSTFKPNKSQMNTGNVGFRSPASTKRTAVSYGSMSPICDDDGKFLGGFCLDDDGQRPNLCRICGKTYARPSTLKTHLRTHSGEKPYRCGDCHKGFSQAANLTAHVRTHSGEKPFRCPICDRRFSQSSSVTTHMRTHSGERPYRCRMCKKAFSDSSTLTKHLRIHSGEKPYQCKLCLLRFSQSGNLNRHMRVHGTSNLIG